MGIADRTARRSAAKTVACHHHVGHIASAVRLTQPASHRDAGWRAFAVSIAFALSALFVVPRPARLGPSAELAHAAPAAPTHLVAPPPGPRIVWGGDVMLGRDADRSTSTFVHSPLAGVAPLLAAADLAVVNLESPLTARPRVVAGPFDLSAPPARAGWLAAAGIDVVSLANNHAGDHGPAGLADTGRALARARVAAVGRVGRVGPGGAWRGTVGGLRLVVLGCDATRLGASGAVIDCAALDGAVRAERARADVVAVVVHWGAEYAVAPDDDQRALGERLAGAGADLVVGSHAHVVQPTRWRDAGRGRTSLVAYGLGNLVFDSPVPSAMRGALLETRLDVGGVAAYRLHPVDVRAGRSVLAPNEARPAWRTLGDRPARGPRPGPTPWRLDAGAAVGKE